MKPTDLMIKDWVMVKVLSQIPNTYVLHTWTANDYFRNLQVKPIPLTPEILEKNGWECNGIFMEKRIGENTQLSWTDICGAVLSQGRYYMCDCNYVHTLQHALRLCGFDELANNFKI